jgi:hypothetical protein
MKNTNFNIISKILTYLSSFLITLILRVLFTHYWKSLKVKIDLKDVIQHCIETYSQIYESKGLVGVYKYLQYNKDRIRRLGFDENSSVTLDAASGSEYITKVDILKKVFSKLHLTVTSFLYIKIILQLIYNVSMIPILILFIVSLIKKILLLTSISTTG